MKRLELIVNKELSQLHWLRLWKIRDASLTIDLKYLGMTGRLDVAKSP